MKSTDFPNTPELRKLRSVLSPSTWRAAYSEVAEQLRKNRDQAAAWVVDWAVDETARPNLVWSQVVGERLSLPLDWIWPPNIHASHVDLSQGAKSLIRQGDLFEAALLLRLYFEKLRPTRAYRLWRGELLRKAGLAAPALSEGERLLSMAGDRALGETLIEATLLGQPPETTREYAERLVKRYGSRPIIRALLARCDAAAPRPDQNVSDVIQVLAAAPRRHWVEMSLARCYRAMSQKDAELACLRSALELTVANDVRNLNTIAVQLEEAGDFEMARQAYAKALSGKDAVFARRPFAEFSIRTFSPQPELPRHRSTPLFLITQIQRSGGTLLSQLFDGHPEVFAHPHELQIGNPHKWIWPKLDLGEQPERWFEQLLEPHLGKFISRGFRKADGNTAAEERLEFNFDLEKLSSTFFAILREDPPQTQRHIIGAFLSAYFAAWRDRRSTGCEKWVTAFTPRLMSFLGSVEGFRNDYPDGILASCIRSPMDWYASAKRHSPEYVDVSHAMQMWKTSTLSALLEYERAPNTTLLLSYEELVTDTEALMRYICRRLEIAFHPTLLTPTFLEIPIKPNSSYANPHVGVQTSSLKKGSLLSESERDVIEREAMPLYRKARTITEKWIGGRRAE